MPDIMIAVQGENEGDDVTYVPLTEYDNASEVIATLPDELVQSHSEFQRLDNIRNSLLDEKRKFQKRAQTAEQKLQENSSSGDDETPDAEPPQQQDPLDIDALRQSLKEEILGEIKTDRQAQTDRELFLQNLVKKHRLQKVEGAMDILSDSNNPEQTAERLGRTRKQFDALDGGTGEMTDDDYLTNMMNNIKGDFNIPVKQ